MTITDLRALSDRATPGEVLRCDGPMGYKHRLLGNDDQGMCDVFDTADARFIAACVNYVRAQLIKSQDYCALCNNNRTVCCFDDENPLGIKACPDCTTKGTRP